MKQSQAEITMKSIAAISAICTVISVLLYQLTERGIWLTLSITAGTFLYHFAMRLVVGLVVNRFIKKPVNYKADWFLLRRWEPKVYRKLGIRRWKNKLPTYYPQDFSIRNHSVQELLQTMCIAEIGHELMIVLSFVPLLLSIWFGTFAVFLITSLCAGMVDLVFVLIQRYNRNRLVKIAERKGMPAC